MNAFFEHHKDSIQFGYRCFDRILVYREAKRVTKRTSTEIADQFQYWLKNRSPKWGTPILDAPEGADDESRRNKA